MPTYSSSIIGIEQKTAEIVLKKSIEELEEAKELDEIRNKFWFKTSLASFC